MAMYGIYIHPDAMNRIVEINSEGLIDDLSDWIRIGEYESDVPYAQGNYFPETIIDERGVWRYCYDPNSAEMWRERTPEEMDGDAAQISQTMSDTDAALVELAGMIADIMQGMAELATLIAGR